MSKNGVPGPTKKYLTERNFILKKFISYEIQYACVPYHNLYREKISKRYPNSF